MCTETAEYSTIPDEGSDLTMAQPASQRAPQVSPFDYLDYRSYLKDWFAAAKKTRASMSYRRFAERAGLKSWNFIMLVIQGKRNLAGDTIDKVCQGLQLNKQETGFFRNLVHFDQAKNHEDRDHHYHALLRSRKYSKLKPIKAHQYEYCSAWYHAVIRELIACEDFDGDVDWLVQRLGGRVTAAQAAHSLELLESLGFIEKTRKGRWRQKDALLSTGAEVESVALLKYHLNMLDLTKTMVESVPGERRDISALTLGVTTAKLPELKKKIQKFRQEILKMVAHDENPEEVVQVNIYMFPVTESEQ